MGLLWKCKTSIWLKSDLKHEIVYLFDYFFLRVVSLSLIKGKNSMLGKILHRIGRHAFSFIGTLIS
ncbi:hypothetical protein FM109_16140 [Vibrio casei]|nr:hypothetical protein FM109_16140 [Vibrio casei]